MLEVGVLDVGVSDGRLMSVVTIGLVLVIVSVVDGVPGAVAVVGVLLEVESTNWAGARSGSLNWPVMNTAAATTSPITANAATLAPATADVELCHDGFAGASAATSKSSSAPVTGTDSNRGRCAVAQKTCTDSTLTDIPRPVRSLVNRVPALLASMVHPTAE